MTIGDGIRRNVATISSDEKIQLRDAIITLNHNPYPGDRGDTPYPGGVSYWFKQDEIHQRTHVHHGPAFLPWHRELTNRFEALIRSVNPMLSLHYWDWTTDPTPLFTPDFMGNAQGNAGDLWLNAGFYNPAANPDRDSSRNPADPPDAISRNVNWTPQPWPIGGSSLSDHDITHSSLGRSMQDQFREMRGITDPDTGRIIRPGLENLHDFAHGIIGGTLGDPHISFRDPFVFLLHSNVDRLFARWQLEPGNRWRLDPNLVYGSESDTQASGEPPEVQVGILSPLEPWAGSDAPNIDSTLGAPPVPVRPWAPPENHQQPQLNSRDPLVVFPPPYNTNPPYPSIFDNILSYVYYIVPDPFGRIEPDPSKYLQTIKGISEPISQNKSEALQQLDAITKQVTDQFKTGKMQKLVYDILAKAISKYMGDVSKKE
jgi:hypothetical protein